MHRNDPQNQSIFVMTPKNIHNIFIPHKYSFFWPPPPPKKKINIEIQDFKPPKNGPSLRIWKYLENPTWRLGTHYYMSTGLEISENRHLPCITKFIGIHGENLIFSRNIKIFTCPAAWDTRKYERTSTIFEPWSNIDWPQEHNLSTLWSGELLKCTPRWFKAFHILNNSCLSQK